MADPEHLSLEELVRRAAPSFLRVHVRARVAGAGRNRLPLIDRFADAKQLSLLGDLTAVAIAGGVPMYPWQEYRRYAFQRLLAKIEARLSEPARALLMAVGGKVTGLTARGMRSKFHEGHCCTAGSIS